MTVYKSDDDRSTLELHQQPEDFPSQSQPTTLDPLTATLTVLGASNPNYHLPVELLTFILNFLFPDTVDRSKNDMAEIYRLRLVSKSWKELIESTPALWTYVSPEYPLVVVRDCLRWSKNHLLRISILYTWSCTVEALFELLQLLQPQSHRWKMLSYATTEMSDPDQMRVRHFLESPAPMLQSLYLCPSHFGDSRVNFAGGVAKGLRHLTLRSANLWQCSVLLDGLETLRLVFVEAGPAEVLSIFFRSPTLRRLDFWDVVWDQSRATASALLPSLDLVANSLEEVSLATDPRLITLILSQLSMPSCKSLELATNFAEFGDEFLGPILNDGLAQFIPRIREALRLGGVARFLVGVGPSRYREKSSLEIEGFRLSFRWSGITTESLTEWIRQLIAKLDFPLELEMNLSTPDRPTVEALDEWNELNVTKLTILVARPEPASMENAVLVLDCLGDVLVDQDGGHSWNFPKLRELDVCSTQFDLSRLLNMLNKRYLPDAYVRDKEKLGISIQTPPRIDLRVRNTTEARGATIIAAIEKHWGVISLQKRTLDT